MWRKKGKITTVENSCEEQPLPVRTPWSASSGVVSLSYRLGCT